MKIAYKIVAFFTENHPSPLLTEKWEMETKSRFHFLCPKAGRNTQHQGVERTFYVKLAPSASPVKKLFVEKNFLHFLTQKCKKHFLNVGYYHFIQYHLKDLFWKLFEAE